MKKVKDELTRRIVSGPYTLQFNYLESLNQIYEDEIFTVTNDQITCHLTESHPYILDLRGEGRMINSTLENLQSQLNGNNDYLAPLNDSYVFFKTKDYNYLSSSEITGGGRQARKAGEAGEAGKEGEEGEARPAGKAGEAGETTQRPSNIYFNLRNNRIPFKQTSDGISEEYKKYPNILNRELHVLGLPPKEENIRPEDWLSLNKLLENKITELTDGVKTDDIEYQILLAINLNDRSTTEEIEVQAMLWKGAQVIVKTKFEFNMINEDTFLQPFDNANNYLKLEQPTPILYANHYYY